MQVHGCGLHLRCPWIGHVLKQILASRRSHDGTLVHMHDDTCVTHSCMSPFNLSAQEVVRLQQASSHSSTQELQQKQKQGAAEAREQEHRRVVEQLQVINIGQTV